MFLSFYNPAETRQVYEEHSDLICWLMKQMMNRRFFVKGGQLRLSVAEAPLGVCLGNRGDAHIGCDCDCPPVILCVHAAMHDELMQRCTSFAPTQCFRSRCTCAGCWAAARQPTRSHAQRQGPAGPLLARSAVAAAAAAAALRLSHGPWPMPLGHASGNGLGMPSGCVAGAAWLAGGS